MPENRWSKRTSNIPIAFRCLRCKIQYVVTNQPLRLGSSYYYDTHDKLFHERTGCSYFSVLFAKTKSIYHLLLFFYNFWGYVTSFSKSVTFQGNSADSGAAFAVTGSGLLTFEKPSVVRFREGVVFNEVSSIRSSRGLCMFRIPQCLIITVLQ